MSRSQVGLILPVTTLLIAGVMAYVFDVSEANLSYMLVMALLLSYTVMFALLLSTECDLCIANKKIEDQNDQRKNRQRADRQVPEVGGEIGSDGL